jgi:hypothetical protein
MSADGSCLVWLPCLAGEVRRKQTLATPRPAFVADPRALGSAHRPEASHGLAALTAWFHRVGTSDSPTHAEVRLADGALTIVAAGWIHAADRIVPLRRPAPAPSRRTA